MTKFQERRKEIRLPFFIEKGKCDGCKKSRGIIIPFLNFFLKIINYPQLPISLCQSEMPDCFQKNNIGHKVISIPSSDEGFVTFQNVVENCPRRAIIHDSSVGYNEDSE